MNEPNLKSALSARQGRACSDASAGDFFDWSTRELTHETTFDRPFRGGRFGGCDSDRCERARPLLRREPIRPGYNNDGYYNFRRQFQHAYDSVRHGLRDGSFTRTEARYFYWAIGDLRQRLDFYRNNDGYLSRREARDMDRRLARLHANMHEAHEVGHDEQDYRYGGRYGDDDEHYGRYGRGDDDHDDD